MGVRKKILKFGTLKTPKKTFLDTPVTYTYNTRNTYSYGLAVKKITQNLKNNTDQPFWWPNRPIQVFGDMVLNASWICQCRTDRALCGRHPMRADGGIYRG